MMKKIGFLLLYFYIANSYADSELNTSNENTSKWAGAFKDTFFCAGMYLIDHGMALDRDGVFVDAKTFKPICTYRGIIAPICEDTTKNQTCTCPPLEWNANNCSKKYSEFRRAKWLEQKKSQEMIKDEKK